MKMMSQSKTMSIKYYFCGIVTVESMRCAQRNALRFLGAPMAIVICDCAVAEDPIRTILNAFGDWVYSDIQPHESIQFDAPLSVGDQGNGDFWGEFRLSQYRR